MHRLGRFWPFAFFFVLPLLPLWRAVFLGEAIGPFDQVRQMGPWNGPVASQPWDVLQVDGVLQFYPWRDLTFEAYRNGHLPLWNPYELAGTPLLANSQSGGFYPPHVLIGLLRIPTAPGITLLAWFHLAWAGLGVFLLARRLGAGRLGAAVGGASFTLSAFMLAWTALSSVIETVSWIPWAFAALFWLFDRPSMRPTSLLALSAGMMLLAGHLQFAAYGFMGLVFLGVWLGIAKRDLRAIGGALASVCAGVVLAFPQLIPVLDYGKFSHRKTEATEAGYEAYVGSALKPFELATLGASMALGNPRQWAQSEQGKAPQYWPQFVKPGANFAESAISVGPLVLMLLFLVPWKRRDLWPLAALGTLAFLLAMGTVLNKLLYFGVPGWAATGSPARVEVLFVMAACVLAAMPFCEPPKSARWTLPIAVVLFFATLLWLPSDAEFARPFARLDYLKHLPTQSAATIFFSLFLALGALKVVMEGPEPNRSRWRLLLVAPVLVALLPFMQPSLVPTGLPLAPPSTGAQRIAVLNEHWGLYGPPKSAALPPNAASLSRIHELGGYDSLLHKDTVEFLKQVDGQDPAPPENGNMMLIKPTATPNMLAEAGVTEIWQNSPSGLQKIPLPGPGRASTPAGPAKIVGESTDGIKVSASSPGPLVLRDRNMPGWEATIDGSRVPIKEGFWREVDLPAGEHSVTFAYKPRGIALLPISLVLFLAILTAIVARPQNAGRLQNRRVVQ